MTEPNDARPARLTILVVRSGGLMGVAREWRVEPRGDDAADWIELVEACPWDAPGVDTDSRDRFTWRIDVRLARTRRAASVPDRDLTGAWRTLVDRVRSAGDG